MGLSFYRHRVSMTLEVVLKQVIQRESEDSAFIDAAAVMSAPARHA